jgi:nitrogen fixation protein FixH
VVIAVNFVMARYAVGTFGGVVVENSYVASQHFNRWLDEAARERTLGWQVDMRRLKDGHVVLAEHSLPSGAAITAIARHPLGRLDDIALTFDASGRSIQALPQGRWIVRLTAKAQGNTWRSEQAL